MVKTYSKRITKKFVMVIPIFLIILNKNIGNASIVGNYT